jgi:hypothetical protein
MFQASVVRCARLKYEENNNINPQQQWQTLKSKEKRM